MNDEVDKHSSWELQPRLHDVLEYLMTMALFPLLPRDMGTLPTPIPTHGLVISTVLSMLTMAILAICLSELHDTYASLFWDLSESQISPENTSDEELGQSPVNKMAYDHLFI